MATLQTKAAPVDAGRRPIGDQRVAQTPSVSFSRAIDQATGSLKAVGSLTEDFVKERGETIASQVVEDISESQGAILAATEARSAGPMPRKLHREIESLEDMARGRVGEKEFEVLNDAMKSGRMSQTAVNLFAADQITQRVQAEPLFAGRVREAAARIIGFDSAALTTQTMLDKLGFDDTKAPTVTPEQKKINALTQEANILGKDVKTHIYESFASEERARVAEDSVVKYKTGTMDYNAALSNVLVDTTSDIGKSVASLIVPNEDGTPPNAFAAKGAVDAWSAAATAKLRGLDASRASTPEAVAAIRQVEDSAKLYKQIIDDHGIEALTEQRIATIDRNYKLWGLENMGKFKVISDYMGADTTDQLTDILLKTEGDPKRAEALFANFPTAKAAYDLLNDGSAISPKGMHKLNESIVSTIEKSINGRPLTKEENLLKPVVMQTMSTNDDGTPNAAGTEKVAELFSSENLLATTSAALRVPAIRAGKASQDAAKNAYKYELPDSIDKAAGWIAEDPKHRGYRTKPDGTIELLFAGQPSPSQNAANIAESVNMYNKGLNKGWGNVLGTTQPELTKFVDDRLSASVDRGVLTMNAKTLGNVADLIQNGDIYDAQKVYERLNDKVGGTLEPFANVKDTLYGMTSVPSDLTAVTGKPISGVLLQDNAVDDLLGDSAALDNVGKTTPTSGVLKIGARSAVDAGFGEDRASSMEEEIRRRMGAK